MLSQVEAKGRGRNGGSMEGRSGENFSGSKGGYYSGSKFPSYIFHFEKMGVVEGCVRK